MDINSVDFLKAFYDRLVDAGYSDIRISNRDDGCVRILEDGSVEYINDDEYYVYVTTPYVNKRAECLSFCLTKNEMDEIPHNVKLDYEELEKYFGRSFD